MASREYWQNRFIQLEQAQLNRGARYFHDLERHYNRAAREVDKELAKWYTRLAVNNELSMTEAKKMLTSRELEEFRWDVEEYIEKGRTLNYSNQWARQLENASARVHISRLEAIKLQMQQQVEVLYGNELDSFDSMMRDIYTESYYRTAYEIQKGVGVGSDLMQLDTRKIDKVMSRPWAADGSNFSSRIWKQKTQLVNELNNHLTQSFIRGLSPEAATKAIAERFNVSKGQAGRLVMTETAFIHSAGQRDMFHELGVEEYEIVATLDTKTSEICRNLDGTHHPMSEYQAGVTAPPFHCWCRTTTVPYFDDEFTEDEVRAARGDDGKTYYVPSNMTYHEWKEAFVDGGSKAQYLRNNLPKGFVDSREVGEVILGSILSAMVERADSYGIKMTGFENYCGDVKVLDDILEHINDVQAHFIPDGIKYESIILNYDNVLGYLGDNSKIDIGAFAETRGKTITLNKFMFDDSDYLKREYEEAVKNGIFAKGTSYLNIADHEFGHIISRKNPNLYRKVLDEIEKMAYNNSEEVQTFIVNTISIYAAYRNAEGMYSEIVSEIYSMANGTSGKIALDILRGAGALYEN